MGERKREREINVDLIFEYAGYKVKVYIKLTKTANINYTSGRYCTSDK